MLVAGGGYRRPPLSSARGAGGHHALQEGGSERGWGTQPRSPCTPPLTLGFSCPGAQCPATAWRPSAAQPGPGSAAPASPRGSPLALGRARAHRDAMWLGLCGPGAPAVRGELPGPAGLVAGREGARPTEWPGAHCLWRQQGGGEAGEAVCPPSDPKRLCSRRPPKGSPSPRPAGPCCTGHTHLGGRAEATSDGKLARHGHASLGLTPGRPRSWLWPASGFWSPAGACKARQTPGQGRTGLWA